MQKVKTIYLKANRQFAADYAHHRAQLSRFTNLLTIANISLFFPTERVTKESYY